MDQIEIHAIRCRVHIGITEQERLTLQPIEIDLRLFLDLRPAGASDDLSRTVDYHRLTDQVVTLAESSRFQLIEALAEHLCAEILADRRIKAVELRLRKYPEAMADRVAYTAVEVRREQA